MDNSPRLSCPLGPQHDRPAGKAKSALRRAGFGPALAALPIGGSGPER